MLIGHMKAKQKADSYWEEPVSFSKEQTIIKTGIEYFYVKFFQSLFINICFEKTEIKKEKTFTQNHKTDNTSTQRLLRLWILDLTHGHSAYIMPYIM